MNRSYPLGREVDRDDNSLRLNTLLPMLKGRMMYFGSIYMGEKAIKITNKIANKIFVYVTLYWAPFQVLLTGEARPGAHSGQGR